MSWEGPAHVSPMLWEGCVNKHSLFAASTVAVQQLTHEQCWDEPRLRGRVRGRVLKAPGREWRRGLGDRVRRARGPGRRGVGAVEVKSKVSRGPAVCAPQGIRRCERNRRGRQLWSAALSTGCAGVRRSFPPLRAHRARQPHRIQPEPRRSEGRAAAGPFVGEVLLLHKPEATLRAARWRGDVSRATRGLLGSGAVEEPQEPWPRECPNRAASVAAEEPRNRRGGDEPRGSPTPSPDLSPRPALRTGPEPHGAPQAQIPRAHLTGGPSRCPRPGPSVLELAGSYAFR
ncbi:uncharacterized protein LOC116664062 [Camelus ferus]|uniref:Uncharacterized protein LOC116664062 n=1 Tax=Camelus ferus TaxID=419612 RepID=A0A8B8T4H7_CAMFR|nr:uncharacterized protein LOC116664062 [Camelus ferus]